MPSPRRLAVALALLALPLTGVPAAAATPEPSPSGSAVPADTSVAKAEEETAAMRAKVQRTAEVLTEGTERLEEGQAALAQVRARLRTAQREAGEAQDSAAQARTRLRAVVSAAYRSPVPDSVALALTAGPEGFRDAMVAQADLDRVRGSQQELLREATAERVRADVLVRKADQLEDDAAARERALAEQVEQLRATALQAERELAAAEERLRTARALRERQLADAAARAARTRALASSATVYATCSGTPVGSQANGHLDPSTLCPLADAPGHALAAQAATAFNALTAARKAATGAPLCVNSSYRSYSGQVATYAAKPHLAAVPGTSNHGWGLAVDLGCGVERFGSEAHEWMRANAGRFGWIHPDWAQAGGSRPEAWHWEYVGG